MFVEVVVLSNAPLRAAVVGLGKMGWLHAGLLNVLPNVELVALCEKSVITRKIAKKIFRSKPVVSKIENFSDLDLDAIFVTTSTPSHYAVAKTIYQERLARNLFIEKPLTLKSLQSRELFQLASQNAGVNMVGYLRRFMVTFIKARELFMKGVIGEPLSFSMRAYSSDFYGFEGTSKASAGRGGVLSDLGSYAIDIAMWFFGDIHLDSAHINSLNTSGFEDAVDFAVHRDSGSLSGKIFASWCVEGYRMPEVELSIVGSNGVIEVNDDKACLSVKDGKKLTWHRLDLDDRVDFWLGAPEYCREDEYFVNSVANRSVAEPSFESASKVDMLIELIRKEALKHD